MIKRTAHAKVNLALHVTGQRDDGYHLLDSLVVFAEYGDVIKVSKPHHVHGPIEVSVDGPFSEKLTSGPENLVTAAAFLLRDRIASSGGETKPVSITLTKNLPIASGIGGGSANAAATLLALQEYWETDVPLDRIALGLGADVPMCLHNKPLRARGIGEEIDLLKCAAPMHLVLVNPGVEVSTPEIFKQLVSKNNSPIELAEDKDFPDFDHIRDHMRNDLEGPARALNSEIDKALDALKKTGAEFVRMSGSGATCFGIFGSQKAAKAAAEIIARDRPLWWCVATQTTVT